MKIKMLTIAALAIIFFASAFSISAQTPDPNNGIFRFNEQFTASTVDSLIDDLNEWSVANPRQPITIVLNSPGGEVVAGFTLIDELTHLRNLGHKVTFVVYGRAASTAGFVLQAADRRIIGANAMILIHQIAGGHSGKLSSLKDDLAYAEKLQNQFIKVLTSRSRLTAKLIHSRIDAGQDWWIDAQEALKLGLVDEIERVPAPQP
jgi:ATP-dependent Clp endopeptidase proteolytic subunit ClpP